jgi:TonB family protein
MMNGFSAVDGLERWQARIIRRMMVLSVVAHGAVILFGSSLSALFPPREFSAPVIVELTDAPVSELPEELPAPPPPLASSVRPAPKEPPAARRWLDKLDAGMAKVPEAPIARGVGKPGGIPVRHWTNDGPAKPGDFAPAVAPEKSAALGKHLEELEGRVRASGRPAVGFGKETEASMMFGGAGDTPGEPIPAWIREMIRKRVRDHLPELEGVYADAIRRNPGLRGKLLVRFRIDPSGKVQRAEPADGSLPDAAFVNAVLDKVRRWTFEPTAGRTVEVLYPFVFVAPS